MGMFFLMLKSILKLFPANFWLLVRCDVEKLEWRNHIFLTLQNLSNLRLSGLKRNTEIEGLKERKITIID